MTILMPAYHAHRGQIPFSGKLLTINVIVTLSGLFLGFLGGAWGGAVLLILCCQLSLHSSWRQDKSS